MEKRLVMSYPLFLNRLGFYMHVIIHKANRKQRLEAHRNSYESWGEGKGIDAYIQRCLTSLRHNRATWWVLEEDGIVVSSLALHPLHFHVGGQTA